MYIAYALGALLLIAPQTAASVQTSPREGVTVARNGTAAVVGTVYDSLARRAAVADAEVWLVGESSHGARTDARGEWRIDGLPPGRYTATFFHSALDSLGVSAPPRPIDVPDSGTVSIALATPSAQTVHAGLCRAPQPPSTGVVLGRVHEAVSDGPVSDATVTAHWTEWSFGDAGLRRQQRRASASGDAGGAFRLCGVPSDVAVVIRAEAQGYATGPIELHMEGSSFVVRSLRLGLQDAAAAFAGNPNLDSLSGEPILHSPQGGRATVIGRVRTTDGRRISDARVMLLGFTVATMTDAAGGFEMSGLPGGTQTVEVRALGYAPARATVDLAAGATDTVVVTLDRNAPVLATLKVLGEPPGRGDWTGFNDRQRLGLGHFIGIDEIERRRAMTFGDLLMGVPGVKVQQAGFSTVVAFPRAGGQIGKYANTNCLPTYFVDGTPVVGGDPTDFLRTKDIYGIEVYVSLASAPARYHVMDSSCGVILIWTKRASMR